MFNHFQILLQPQIPSVLEIIRLNVYGVKSEQEVNAITVGLIPKDKTIIHIVLPITVTLIKCWLFKDYVKIAHILKYQIQATKEEVVK